MKPHFALVKFVQWGSLACLFVYSALECWLMVIAETGQRMTGAPDPPGTAIQWLFLASQFTALAVVYWTRLPLVLIGGAEWVAMFLEAALVKQQTLSRAVESTTLGAVFLALAIVHWLATKMATVMHSRMLL